MSKSRVYYKHYRSTANGKKKKKTIFGNMMVTKHMCSSAFEN